MTRYWPRFNRAGFEESVAPIDYLEWYIPRLEELRAHNLSFSGMQYNWNVLDLLGDTIADIAKPYMGDVDDPKEIIAARESVNFENVLITNGATQGINIALLTDIDKIRNKSNGKITVAVESPTYAPIPQSALILADDVIRVNRYPPKDYGHWRINYEEWSTALKKSDILMITPISNPSGWFFHKDDLAWIIDQAKISNVTIIADEAYNDAYREIDDYCSIHSVASNSISINSLTKVYAMGHIRFGWIVSDSETIDIARRIFMTFSGIMSSPAMRIGTKVLQQSSIVDEAIADYRSKNLPKLRSIFAKHGIVWNEPLSGVFGCFELPNGIHSELFADHYCKVNDLLVVPGTMFSDSMQNWVRVAWSIDPKSFELAVDALNRSLELALNQKQVNKSK